MIEEPPAEPSRLRSIHAARAATVGASKITRSGSSTPRARRTRETTRVASREWPPRSKKSSPAPTRSTAQDLAPDRRQLPLGAGRRLDVSGGGGHALGREGGAGERPAVHLAARRQRQGRQPDEGGGDHRRRQRRLERRAQNGLGALPFPDHVGDQAQAPRVLPRHHRGVAHAGVGDDRHLHLAGLDAVAAHLDLEVGPPEVFEVATRPSIAPGPRCGRAGRPAPCRRDRG